MSDHPLAGRMHFGDELFDGQLLRSLRHAQAGCADLGECFSTAFRIQEGDFESWYREWRATALRVQGLAEDARAKGHLRSAGKAFLRAGEYHRQAEWFLREDLHDPRLLQTADAVRDCLRRGLDCLGMPWREVGIPYGPRRMPGYFLPARAGVVAPTILMPGGYDSFAEECFAFGRASLERGYNLLVWDGPGQGQFLRRERVYFRPDAEVQIGPAVDEALKQPETRPDRLVLRGVSFAGYLAPRMASAEPRLAALVADTALYDLGGLMLGKLQPPLRDAVLAGDDATVDEVLGAAMAADPSRRFFFRSRMATHGARTPSEYLRMLQDYTLVGRAERIACPTFVGGQEADQAVDQGPLLAAALRCPHTYVRFLTAEGAGDHAVLGSPARLDQVVHDWLDETLG